MTRLTSNAFSLCFTLVMALPAPAYTKQSEILIAAGEMPHLMSAKPEYSGAYNVLMQQVKKEIKQKFKLFYLPPGRAGQEFEKQHFDCLMPGQMSGMKEKNKRIASVSFNYARAYIFNSVKQPAISTFEALHGKVLATRRGFVYGNLEFDKEINRLEVNHIQQSIDMLKKKRIDAFVAYEPDIISILKNMPEPVVHRSNMVLHQQPEKIVCHRSEKTKAFVKAFNRSIKDLTRSGKLKEILGTEEIAR